MSPDRVVVATYTVKVPSEDPEGIDRVLDRIDSVREMAGSMLLLVLGIASVAAGGGLSSPE
jgi:hypothetical protein